MTALAMGALLAALVLGGGALSGAPPAEHAGRHAARAGEEAGMAGETKSSDQVKSILEANEIVTLLWAKSKPREALATVPDLQPRLRALALGDGPALLRFKALEVFLAIEGDGALGAPELKPRHGELAGVYAGAIRALQDLNVFNLPEAVKSSGTSRHVIALGREALPGLAPLLDHCAEAPYEGSEEATIAAMHHVRVCDLGAALVAAIVGEEYVNAEDPEVRDEQIARLKKVARSGGGRP